MDSMEVNKVISAVLVAGITFFLAGTIGDHLIHETPLKSTHIKIDVQVASATSATPAPEVLPPIAPLLVKADPAAGEAITKRVGCSVCHSFNEGGKAIVGPNLYGVVGGPHAHMAGYPYSEALKSKKGPWTYAALNEWLYKPSKYAPGTRMSFAGLPKAEDRADVIAYLRTLSPHPEPLPTPAEVQAAEAASKSASAAPSKPAGPPPIDTLLASADPAAGEADTHKLGCIACHTFNDGGKAGIGPNLYGVVGGPHAHMEGFNYSTALKSKKGPWTFEALNEWLTKPAAYAPGTRMTFAGVSNPKERADIIDYLRTLAKNPEPLPAK